MSEPLALLTVVASDFVTEIYLIDHQLLLCAQGLGRLEVEVKPGIYKLKWRVGYDLRERFLHLDLDHSPHHVELDSIPILSAAPLIGSIDHRDDHASAAAEASRTTHRRAGSGADLFFFSRQVPASAFHDDKLTSANGHSTCYALLLTAEGQPVAELTREGTSGSTWCACTVELDPGSYRLRLEDAETRATEMTVPVPAGRQAQVFFLRRSCDRGEPAWKDLALFLSAETGFDSDSPVLLQTERLRWAFAQRRHLASDHAHELLKHCSWRTQPLQALFLAHLLLLGPSEVKQHLPPLIDALRGLLPDGDVIPLELEAGLDAASPITSPPLLRRSWEILVRHSARNPALIPPTHDLARIAGRVVGAEPWLAWVHDLDATRSVRRAVEHQIRLVEESRQYSLAAAAAPGGLTATKPRARDLPHIPSSGSFTFSGGPRASLPELAGQLGSTLFQAGKRLLTLGTSVFTELQKPGSKQPAEVSIEDRLAHLLTDDQHSADELEQDLVELLGLPRSVVQAHLNALLQHASSTEPETNAPLETV